MIKEYILSRAESLVSDHSHEQKKLWSGEVIDFRINEDLSPLAQEVFDVQKHIIAPTYLKAKTYTRGSEFKLVLDVKMSNNDHLIAIYRQISNKIHRDRHQEQLGRLKIVINGEELKDYYGWTISSLSNFSSLRKFYFENWLPAMQPS